ncbi:DUF1289 domain-containing protein [Methylobacterium sp. E-005]|uniref:DUF1289 domain-containing protein n=1 Tax=Methylobacterium sp. E-005 TaxID=2836549 RepID=UPI001FBA23D9|nr:DUF1289 domain-containing protein [Methylobacterium sp. E-005]MCJ2086693.1 DUF1289 domain-containing protein [Methylobacterium sp. E-005]
MKKDDPCVGVCRWDGRTGWCVGCGRTVPEIKAWRTLSPYRRSALLRELPRRVAQCRLSSAKQTSDLSLSKADTRPAPLLPEG